MAAQRSSADADTTHDLGLVSHTYLAQLYTGLKYTCKVLYQLSEVNSSVCCEIEQHLIIVKGIFRIDQLHFQVVLFDLFLADLKCFFFFLFVFCLNGTVLIRCHTDHRLKRWYYLCLIYFSVSKNYVTVFNTSGSFYDHMVPNFYLTVCRIKIVDLSGSPKTHSDYC